VRVIADNGEPKEVLRFQDRCLPRIGFLYSSPCSATVFGVYTSVEPQDAG